METVRVDHLGHYLPKSYFKQDEFSLKLLDFKENKVSARFYFTQLLKRRLKLTKGSFILCCVPPSKKDKPNPMRRVIEILCTHFPNMQNGVDLLHRRHDMPSLCKGGERDYYKIKESLDFDFIMPVWGKSVILLDDVLTTGISISICAEILKQYGVKKVYGLVLARTLYKYVKGRPVGQPAKITLIS